MSNHPFLKARMLERLDRIQDATAKPYDRDSDISLAIAFGDGDDRRSFRWPIERDAAKRLHAELGKAIARTR